MKTGGIALANPSVRWRHIKIILGFFASLCLAAAGLNFLHSGQTPQSAGSAPVIQGEMSTSSGECPIDWITEQAGLPVLPVLVPVTSLPLVPVLFAFLFIIAATFRIYPAEMRCVTFFSRPPPRWQPPVSNGQLEL